VNEKSVDSIDDRSREWKPFMWRFANGVIDTGCEAWRKMEWDNTWYATDSFSSYPIKTRIMI
jgi:hypothetical protein